MQNGPERGLNSWIAKPANRASERGREQMVTSLIENVHIVDCTEMVGSGHVLVATSA